MEGDVGATVGQESKETNRDNRTREERNYPDTNLPTVLHITAGIM